MGQGSESGKKETGTITFTTQSEFRAAVLGLLRSDPDFHLAVQQVVRRNPQPGARRGLHQEVLSGPPNVIQRGGSKLFVARNRAGQADTSHEMVMVVGNQAFAVTVTPWEEGQPKLISGSTGIGNLVQHSYDGSPLDEPVIISSTSYTTLSDLTTTVTTSGGKALRVQATLEIESSAADKVSVFLRAGITSITDASYHWVGEEQEFSVQGGPHFYDVLLTTPEHLPGGRYMITVQGGVKDSGTSVTVRSGRSVVTEVVPDRVERQRRPPLV